MAEAGADARRDRGGGRRETHARGTAETDASATTRATTESREHGLTHSPPRLANKQGKGDAAYNSLDYVAVCPHMPICQPVCTEQVFHWVKKGHAAAQIK